MPCEVIPCARRRSPISWTVLPISHDRVRSVRFLGYQTMQFRMGNPTNQFPTQSDDAMRSYRARNFRAYLRVLARPHFFCAYSLRDLWELGSFSGTWFLFGAGTWFLFGKGSFSERNHPLGLLIDKWKFGFAPWQDQVFNLIFNNKHRANLSVSFFILLSKDRVLSHWILSGRTAATLAAIEKFVTRARENLQKLTVKQNLQARQDNSSRKPKNKMTPLEHKLNGKIFIVSASAVRGSASAVQWFRECGPVVLRVRSSGSVRPHRGTMVRVQVQSHTNLLTITSAFYKEAKICRLYQQLQLTKLPSRVQICQ